MKLMNTKWGGSILGGSSHGHEGLHWWKCPRGVFIPKNGSKISASHLGASSHVHRFCGLVHPSFLSGHCPHLNPIEITRVGSPTYDLWNEPPSSHGGSPAAGSKWMVFLVEHPMKINACMNDFGGIGISRNHFRGFLKMGVAQKMFFFLKMGKTVWGHIDYRIGWDVGVRWNGGYPIAGWWKKR